MSQPSPRFILPLCAALLVGCTSDHAVGPEPPRHVLTKVELAPGEIALTLDGKASLTLNAWDQSGARMPETYPGQLAEKATWVSDASTVATVNGDGIVTGVAPGSARISARLSLTGVSLSASMTVTVVPPTDSTVIVTESPNKRWSPTTVRIRAGGTVMWVIPSYVTPSTIWLNIWDENPEKLVFTDGVATRIFPTPGTYSYGTGGGLMWDEEGGKIVVY